MTRIQKPSSQNEIIPIGPHPDNRDGTSGVDYNAHLTFERFVAKVL
jgi:hypothetical protein